MIETTTIYARELIDKFLLAYDNEPIAIKSACIALDEIIKELKSIRITLSPGSYVSYKDYQRDVDGIQQDAISKLLFLGEVKRQIEQL
jgi:hypothetical protein